MFSSYHSHFRQLSSNVKLFLIGNAIQGMGLSIYGLLFSLYLKELGYGESSIGSLISTTSLGISLMAIPASLIIERFHVKQLVITGMVLSSVFYFLQILTVNESSLFTFGLLGSMFLAIYNISVSPFYLRNSSPEVRVHLFTLNSGLNIMAHMIGYLIGGYLPKMVRWFDPTSTRIDSFRSAIMVALMLVFLSNLIFMRIRRVPIPKVKRALFDGWKEKEWKILGKLIVPKLFFAFGGGLVVPFLNLYLKEKFKLSTDMIGVSYAILQLCIFVGIFITPTLLKKTTHLKFMMITSMLSVPFMITMGIAASVPMVLTCFFMRGMMMNMSGPITSMFEMEHVREKDCVFASAIILFCYHLVYTCSTRIGGLMIEKYSFGPTFYMAGASYATAVFLYYRFFRHEDEVRKVKLEPAEVMPEAA
ncbi:MAG TPA: MFS transporter [Bacteriovoracaceae bacterium]|nr:MFS transporter [Bacteriovoracaceae bacterium]